MEQNYAAIDRMFAKYETEDKPDPAKSVHTLVNTENGGQYVIKVSDEN